MKRAIATSVLMCILVTASCIFGSRDYQDLHEQYVKSVGAFVEQYFDNGYIINAIVLHPRHQSHDGFYLVESPEMLDSIFELISYEFEYTPRLETFFPEDGMLLIFEWNLFYGDDLLNYQISTAGDTVLVDLNVRDWSLDGDAMPCVSVFVFPIGIVCDEETYPKLDR